MMLAIARSLVGVDQLPVNRASRAYPALSHLFEWSADLIPTEALQAQCSPTNKKKKRNRKKKKQVISS